MIAKYRKLSCGDWYSSTVRQPAHCCCCLLLSLALLPDAVKNVQARERFKRRHPPPRQRRHQAGLIFLRTDNTGAAANRHCLGGGGGDATAKERRTGGRGTVAELFLVRTAFFWISASAHSSASISVLPMCSCNVVLFTMQQYQMGSAPPPSAANVQAPFRRREIVCVHDCVRRCDSWLLPHLFTHNCSC